MNSLWWQGQGGWIKKTRRGRKETTQRADFLSSPCLLLHFLLSHYIISGRGRHILLPRKK